MRLNTTSQPLRIVQTTPLTPTRRDAFRQIVNRRTSSPCPNVLPPHAAEQAEWRKNAASGTNAIETTGQTARIGVSQDHRLGTTPGKYGAVLAQRRSFNDR